MPQIVAQGDSEVRQSPASHTLLPGRVFLAQTGGHLVIGLSSKHPTFPRKLTDVRASKKGQQQGARPFGVRGSRKQLTKDINEHSSQSLGLGQLSSNSFACLSPSERRLLQLDSCFGDLQGVYFFKKRNSKIIYA